jgi:CubicO group peptidase (beta-lactamase class C family)
MLPTPLLSLALSLALITPAVALDDAALSSLLQQRLDGDRTNACLVAAVIDAEGVARAVACADAEARRPWSADSAFEIGSVSKTLNGLLLQQLIDAGELDLDDPVHKHLPKGVKMPQHGDTPITLRHLLTHTSGLPSLAPSWPIRDPANPYREVDRKALHKGLASLSLSRAPGQQFEYSNMGAMLLSDIISRSAGKPFAELAAEQVFAPLGMASFVDKAPKGVATVEGHAPNGQPVPAWDFDPALAGVGGVRASLNDMVRYVEAQMGRRASPLDAAIRSSQQPIHPEGARPMAMGWMIAPLNGQPVLVHEGGTGGFSSFVAFNADHSRGVIVLSDTALTSLGGLSSVGLHLLDQRIPLGKPRLAMDPPVELLDKLVGEYRLQGAMKMHLRRQGGALEIQAEGQPAFVMGYDSEGDFYPLAFDAVLRPQVSDDRVSFVWLQGGGAVPASRVDESAPTQAPAALAAYAGSYPLMPGFALKVFVERGALMAQATGQGAFALDAAGDDVFRADAFGIEIRFSRDEAGEVASLALHQGGQILRGKRQ